MRLLLSRKRAFIGAGENYHVELNNERIMNCTRRQGLAQNYRSSRTVMVADVEQLFCKIEALTFRSTTNVSPTNRVTKTQ
jgi:hypothetical protein